MILARRHPDAARRIGFTLVEMLVVIAIIVVLIVVTLPSFSTLISSSNYTAAISQTTASLGSARSIAMSRGVQTAVAFLFDVSTERYTLVILEEAVFGTNGALSALPTGPPEHTYAVGFRPARNTTPIELPKGTAVFGLSYAHVPDPVNNKIDQVTEHWYAGEIIDLGMETEENPWIFPRNDPILFWETGNFSPAEEDNPWSQLVEDGLTDEVRAALRHANSFCVQFNPDGSTVTSFARGSFSSPANAYIEFPFEPVDAEPADPVNNPESLKPYDFPTIFDPENEGERFEQHTGIMIGERSRNPEVILRTVAQLAVVDLKQLQKGTGVAGVWKLHPSTSLAPWPMYDPDGRPLSDDELEADDAELDTLVRTVSGWIDLNAEIIGFDRYTGSAIRSAGR
jgi:prepilin-type N-terminal cleavage/methylation domain-containing protein